MSLIAYDSARPRLIPPSPPAIFPYSDGHYSWSHREFPAALYRYITTQGNPNSDIADYEPGCIDTPARLVTWANDRLEKHGNYTDLTVYTDRDNFPVVVEAMAGFSWHLFLATLDYSKPTSWGGKPVRAVQFTDRKGLYDMSEVFDEEWLNRP